MTKKYSFDDHPEHRALLSKYRDRWIANAMSTDPMTDEDRAECCSALEEMYLQAGLEWHGRVVFVPSPLVGAFATGFASYLWDAGKPPQDETRIPKAIAHEAATEVDRRAMLEVDATDEAKTWDEVFWGTDDPVASATAVATNHATYASTTMATADATTRATRAATARATGAATANATQDASQDASQDVTTWAATTRVTIGATTRVTIGATLSAVVRATTRDTAKTTAIATLRDVGEATARATWGATANATRAATEDATTRATWSAAAEATRAAARDVTEDATWEATYASTADATMAATLGATEAATLGKVEDPTLGATETSTEEQVWEATENAVGDATWAGTYAATRDAASTAAINAVEEPLSDSWYHGVCDMPALAIALGCGKKGLEYAKKASWLSSGGNQWAGAPARLEFFREVARLPIDWGKWIPWKTLAERSGPRYLHKDFCIVSERPERLLVDDQNRPHCDDGPFCRWRDGVSLYAIHGTYVPWWIVELPERLTVGRIQSEGNVEVRRIMIDRYGLERFMLDSQADLIHEEEDELGNPLRLYRANDEGDEPIVTIRLVNSTPEPDGTFREYMIRVPPNMTRATEARNWVCYLPADALFTQQT
jgi:hypothetical protein